MGANLNRVHIQGQGAPLLILHGMGGISPVEPLAKELAKHYMTIVPVMPGFDSLDGLITYNDQLYINFIENIRNDLQIKEWAVLGYSMGGRTALNYTLANRQQVSVMILIDAVGVGYMNPLVKTKTGKNILSTIVYYALKSKWFQRMYGKTDFCDTNTNLFIKATNAFLNMVTDNTIRKNFSNILPIIGCPIAGLENRLPKLTVPTLLLWGEDDKTAPVEWGIRLDSLLPNSTLKVAKGQRHMALVENITFFYEHIILFIRHPD